MIIKNAKEIARAAEPAIYDIINQYVPLKKNGASYKACCPFHQEKTPSFVVTPSKGIFKCFGCGAGGDAISFLMEHPATKMSYPEAVEYAAKIMQHPVEYDDSIDREQFLDQQAKKKSHEAALSVQLEHVVNFYQEAGLPFQDFTYTSLIESKSIDPLINIDGRPFLLSTIRTFQLCFAPSGNVVANAIEKRSWSRGLLKELGIVREGDYGEYDFFRDRVIFPIHNHMGQLVGAAGRALKGSEAEAKAKYLNLPESMLYEKGTILYGLHLAKKTIAKQNTVFLVEGYTDVMGLHENGIYNAVASCGTAFTFEQAKLLKRFSDNLVILRDGDEAGKKAMFKDIDTAVRAGIRPVVVEMLPGEDPESYLRKYGAGAFRELVDSRKEDAVIYRIMAGWDPDSPFRMSDCFNLAVDLLSYYEDEVVRDAYIKKLSANNRMGAMTRKLKKAMEAKQAEVFEQKTRKLTPRQTQDAINYGIFEQNNKYYISKNVKHGTGVEISNFIINPIMLVVARGEQRRLVEIINEYGHKFIADIDSRIFASFERFSQYVEGMGNYLYNEEAKAAHHIKIKRKVYHTMPTCYPIYTMGWHKEGFWTWSNGIYTLNMNFKATDHHGIVPHGDAKYFLKAHSNIEIDIKSDDDETGMEDQKNFMYMKTPDTISFTEWTQRIAQVHGKNGMLAVAWFCAALFRDLIYPLFNCFPHLFLFGPPRSGKSWLAWSLQYMFAGNPKPPTHVIHATDAAFTRSFSWVRNGVTWMDEYGNEAPYERIEALKMAYDGTGREKAKGGYGHAITRTPINSAVCISGQQQPTQDVALFTRCVSLSFHNRQFTAQEEQNSNDLKAIEQTGQLTQLTMQLVSHREFIKKNLMNMIDAKKASLRNHLQAAGIKIDSRLVTNYAIILAIGDLMAKKFEYGFSLADMEFFAIENLITQCAAIDNQDETAVFWNIIAYLVSKSMLTYNNDILVEKEVEVSIMNDEDRNDRKDSVSTIFEEEKRLVYLNLTKAHGEYQERHQRIRNKPGLDIEALKFYLRNSDAYVGQKRGKKFGGRTKSCFVFDAGKLPIELLLTTEWTLQE